MFEVFDRVSDTFKLGRGAYANVYRAKTHVQKQYALKIQDIDDHFVYYHTKLREALTNKNSFGVPFVGVLLENKRYKGFASELASCSLHRLRQLTSKKILTVAKQLSQRLSQYHAQGIVHGDIKPANIVMFQGKATFCDFGLCMWTTEKNPLNQISAKHSDVIYTPNYRCPELFENGPWTIEASMDMWALGMTLYCMICPNGHCTLGNSKDVEVSLHKTFPKDFTDCVKYLQSLCGPYGTEHVESSPEEPKKELAKDDIFLCEIIATCLRFQPLERMTAVQLASLTNHYDEDLSQDIQSVFIPAELALCGPSCYRESTIVKSWSNQKEVRLYQAEICSSICRKILHLIGIQIDMTILGSTLKLFEIFGDLWTTNARAVYATILPIMLCKSSNVFTLSWLIKIAGNSFIQFDEEFHEALAIAICDSSWSSSLWPNLSM